jgi:peptidoglycan lytic transglycosylase
MRKSFFPIPLLATVLVSLALVSCGGGKSPAPTSTGVTQTAVEQTPESTVRAEDLAQADVLYSEGAVEEATEIYTRVIDSGDDGQRQQALWALARLHYQEGDNGAAKDTVDAYLGEKITPDAERLALLLKGRLHAAQGDNDEAEKALTAYVSAGGPAAPYARLQLAELAARRGDIARAAEQTNQTLLDGLPAGVTTHARFSLAGYFWDSGDIASAIALYEQLGVEAETRDERGEALWLAAALAHDAGDPARAFRSVSTLLAAYPSHERAFQALDDPRFAPSIALGSRALVLFSHRVNGDAASAYQSIVDAGDPTLAADAQYHLGILAERFDNYEQALAHYDASIAAAAAGQQAAMLGQALWDKALVLELLGRGDEAIQTYVSIADVAPSSEHTAEALFRAGILRFKQGLPTDAAAILGRQRSLAADPESQARAYFWASKASEAAGDDAGAERDLALAAALPGADYYTLRARAVLNSQDGLPSGNLPEDDPDWGLIEEWLRTQYGLEDTAARTKFFASPAYLRTRELLEAGLRAEAAVEFEQLVGDASGNAWLLYRLTRAASEEGLYAIAARAAGGFAGPDSSAPPQVMSLAYPVIYPRLVGEQASRNDISPHLILALVRQESFYDARAVSPADATGLTQVIPTTAEGIADELGEENFRNADLKRPNVSLRFGAHYLGAQIDLLEGNIPAALAAYNGGPGNAFRWQDAAGSSDPDVFLETIDYEETRAYVELVLENYAVYLYAYGLTDEPSLPLD